MREVITSLIGSAGGASARGAAHIAHGKPNQDSVAWEQSRLWTYIAAADGHGSAPHYRSDRGSRFGVETAIAVLREATADGRLREHETLERNIPTLAKAVVAGWRARVEADIATDPIPQAPGFASHTVYGSTCLAAAIGPGITLLMQLGDGNIFIGAPSGDIEVPFPDDEMEGEQTYSLCLPDAAEHFKISLFRAPNPFAAPDFVMATTDGFPKSFEDINAALPVVRQYREASRTRGLAAVVAELEPWLARCSEMGSGDDTSVAIYAVEHHDAAAPALDPAATAKTDAGPAARRLSPDPQMQGPTRRPRPVGAVIIGILLGGLVGTYAAAIAGDAIKPYLPGVKFLAATIGKPARVLGRPADAAPPAPDTGPADPTPPTALPSPKVDGAPKPLEK